MPPPSPGVWGGQLTLSSHHLRLRPRQAHHDATVGHGLDEQGVEGGAGPAQRRARVHVLLAEDEGFADLAEDPGDEGLLLVGEVVGRGDDGHGFADLTPHY